MTNPETPTSLTLPLKHWLRLQSILSVLEEHGFNEVQMKFIRESRTAFNQALDMRRADAEQWRILNAKQSPDPFDDPIS